MDLVVDEALARELELAQATQNVEYAHALRRMTPQSGAEVLESAGGRVIYAGPGSPLSQALAMGLSGPVSVADVERMEAFLSRGEGPIQVEVLPMAHPSLAALLEARGYKVAEHQHVLGRRLADPLPERADMAAQVRPIAPGEQAGWARTVAQGFLEKDDIPAGFEELLLPTTACPSTTCYAAFIGGEMVGTGSLGIAGRVAVLSGTGVRVAFRGRGLQGALIRSRLEAARGGGAELAVSGTRLGTTSQRNLERAGFRVLYSKMVMTR